MRKLTGTGEGEVTKREDDDNNNDEDEPASSPGSGPGPRNLKMLDTTIYTLDATQLASIVRSQEALAVLSASVIADVNDTKASKAALLDALQGGKDGHGGKELEIIEIVGIPEVGDDQNVSGLLLSIDHCPLTFEILLKVFHHHRNGGNHARHIPYSFGYGRPVS
jgi:hypothetical protein